MTEAEYRIIEFLMASGATRPAELPDWLLALLEGDHPDELSHELITAASLMYVRRLRPGIDFDAARALIADYAADPARLDDMSCRITAFRLATHASPRTTKLYDRTNDQVTLDEVEKIRL